MAVYVFRRTPGGGTAASLNRLEFLQLRRSEADDAYGATWQTVYGSAEEGETAAVAARRELSEETALVPISFFQVEYVETFYFGPSDHISLMPVFAAEVASDARPRLNAEHDDFRWIADTNVDTHFMWRSQREAIRVLKEQLECAGVAHRLLQVPLPGSNRII